MIALAATSILNVTLAFVLACLAVTSMCLAMGWLILTHEHDRAVRYGWWCAMHERYHPLPGRPER